MTVGSIMSEGKSKMVLFGNTEQLNTAADDKHTAPVLPACLCDEVIRYYSPMIYRIALTKTKSTDDAEDILQEVFLKLLYSKKEFESEEYRKAWLIRVTINCCNSHFTSPWRRNVQSLDDVLADTIADDNARADTLCDGEDVYAKILKLPENMREVILLFYYEDMSVREIANAIGISEDNVKKRLSRARQRLRLELSEDGL